VDRAVTISKLTQNYGLPTKVYPGWAKKEGQTLPAGKKIFPSVFVDFDTPQ
jgi:hypothetical protein